MCVGYKMSHSALVFGMSSVSKHRFRATSRLAGILACVCAALIIPLACASPIYAPPAETQTDSLPSASPAVANEMALGGVIADLRTWLSVIPRLVQMDPTLRIFATRPADIFWTFSIAVDDPPSIEGPSHTEPLFTDIELQSLTIGEMRYTTGFSFDPNDCYAEVGARPCNSSADALAAFAVALAPGQSNRPEGRDPEGWQAMPSTVLQAEPGAYDEYRHRSGN